MKKVSVALTVLLMLSILSTTTVSCGEPEPTSKMTAIEVCEYADQRLSDSYKYDYDPEKYPNHRAELYYQAVSATQIDEGIWSVRVNVTIELQQLIQGKRVPVDSETNIRHYWFYETTATLDLTE